MTNYSFDPPAKKAMDEAELSELISGMSADESGIEKAMKILQEQEVLRLEDDQNFQKWREALLEDGSTEALRAIEKVTGEVLTEPEPDSTLKDHGAEKTSEAESEDEDNLPSENLEQPAEAETSNDVEDETLSVDELADEQVEVIEESITVIDDGEDVEISYQSVTVSTETRKITPADSVQSVMQQAAVEMPSKIRQRLSSKFVLGISVAAGIFGLLSVSDLTLLPTSQWSAIGMLAGVFIGFGIYVAQGFQKLSFIGSVSTRLNALGVYWKIALLVAVSLLAVSVSNLARDNNFFTGLNVEPAKIIDYEIDEITLLAIGTVLFASVIAWQSMLRFGLIRLIAVVALVSVGFALSAVESIDAGLGDWDYQAFLAGFIAALIITTGLSVLLQPGFASDHERPEWAIGEFSTRARRVTVAHGFLFILIPGLLSYIFISAEVSLSDASELAQAGLLLSAGLAMFIAVLGVFDFKDVYLRIIALALVSAGLVTGEYLANDWVEGLALIGLILLVGLLGGALVARFFGEKIVAWIVFVASGVAILAGWLIENPFGLLDLGFEGYEDLQGYGLGVLVAAVISAVISIGAIRKQKVDENV
ncbi:MAG: hypothetical protein RI530_01195 [Microbacteriaceae bacterium]|nr:hypothetical protein [Microbacteriaceae bacterium]